MTIQFRCWYCNKRYRVANERIGERVTCSCDHPLRVPKRSGGRCRIKTPIDWVVEALVYGGGCGLLGAGLGVLIVALLGGRGAGSVGFWSFGATVVLIGGLALFGFCVGLFGGEAGMNWIGRMIRSVEDD